MSVDRIILKRFLDRSKSKEPVIIIKTQEEWQVFREFIRNLDNVIPIKKDTNYIFITLSPTMSLEQNIFSIDFMPDQRMYRISSGKWSPSHVKDFTEYLWLDFNHFFRTTPKFVEVEE